MMQYFDGFFVTKPDKWHETGNMNTIRNVDNISK